VGHLGLTQGTMAAADLQTRKVGYKSVRSGYRMPLRTSHSFSIFVQSRPVHVAFHSVWGIARARVHCILGPPQLCLLRVQGAKMNLYFYVTESWGGLDTR
jgi:hypothetical protein